MSTPGMSHARDLAGELSRVADWQRIYDTLYAAAAAGGDDFTGWTSSYDVGLYVDIDGPIDAELFAEAIRRCMQEYDTTRVRVFEVGGELRQRVEPIVPWELSRGDFGAEADPEAASLAWMRADMARVRPLGVPPHVTCALLHLGAGRNRWYVCVLSGRDRASRPGRPCGGPAPGVVQRRGAAGRAGPPLPRGARRLRWLRRHPAHRGRAAGGGSGPASPWSARASCIPTTRCVPRGRAPRRWSSPTTAGAGSTGRRRA